MKKLIYVQTCVCVIIGLLITSCSSTKPETSITTITGSATEISYTTITLTTTTTITTNLTIYSYPEEYNQILALLLKTNETDGNYTVVDPKTSIGTEFLDTEEEKKNFIINVATRFRNVTYDFSGLAIKLYEINLKYKYLTLQSSIDDGYYVDYDGKFSQYFTKDGGGWEKWHREYPEAHGSTSVSLPAYDPQTGYVLVYIGTQYDWLMGQGVLGLYKYIDGQLINIDFASMWVS